MTTPSKEAETARDAIRTYIKKPFMLDDSFIDPILLYCQNAIDAAVAKATTHEWQYANANSDGAWSVWHDYETDSHMEVGDECGGYRKWRKKPDAALASAKEDGEMLRKILGDLLGYREHRAHCDIDQTDFCSCGLKEVADKARDALERAADILTKL